MRINVEAAVISYLASRGFTCSADAPADAVGEFVTVDRTGGTHDDYVDRATVTLDCVAPTRYGASELALAVDSVMEGLTSLPHVHRVEKQSIQNLSHIVEGREGLYRCVYRISTADLPSS